MCFCLGECDIFNWCGWGVLLFLFVGLWVVFLLMFFVDWFVGGGGFFRFQDIIQGIFFGGGFCFLCVGVGG